MRAYPLPINILPSVPPGSLLHPRYAFSIRAGVRSWPGFPAYAHGKDVGKVSDCARTRMLDPFLNYKFQKNRIPFLYVTQEGILYPVEIVTLLRGY